MNINTVAVLGFGTMGAGIAQSVAQSGRQVLVLETTEGRIKAGQDSLDAFLSTGVARGKHTEAEKAEIQGRVSGVTGVDQLKGVDLVIEVVTENMDVKKSLLGQVASVVGPDVPLLTNTSALSVTDLASDLEHPERVAGLHFFNPAPLMKIVEIVRALQTREDLVLVLEEFVRSMGKTPVVVKDRPGFLVNWLLLPYLNDVMRAYDEELASAEDIDTAMRLGLGYKQGPMELLDLIGLDVHLHATTNAYEATHDSRFAAPPLLSQMVAAGYLGNKSQRGFRKGEEVQA